MKDDPLNRCKVKRGEDLPWSKLTADDVRLIRELFHEGQYRIEQTRRYCTARALADKFGVHRRTIEKVIARVTWWHVED